MELVWLNKLNGASDHMLTFAEMCEREFYTPLTYVEMGVAYGGGCQTIGRMFRWTVYGFDTFTGHPKQLAYDPGAFEAYCMDYWYEPAQYGTASLSKAYQQKVLDEENLSNVHLIEGLIQEDSCKDIPAIHLCLIDLDMIASTRTAYTAVADKMVKGSYLMMHDALPVNHLPKIHDFVYTELKGNGWIVVGEYPNNFLCVLKKL